MDLVTLIVDVVLALWVVAVLMGIVRAINARPPRMAPLPEQMRARFEMSWDRIASRFVYEPQWAIGEADSLVMSLLSARGQPLDHARLPRWIQRARHDAAAAAGGRQRDRTEAMRQVLLQYRDVFDHVLGPRPRRVVTSTARREVAS